MERVTDEKLKIKRKRSRSDSRGRSKKHKHKSRKKHKRYYESSDSDSSTAVSSLSGGSSPSPSPSRHRKKKKKDSKKKSKHKIRKEKKIVKTSGSTVEQKTDRLATKSSTGEPDGSKSDIAKLKASLATTPGAQGSKARGPMTKEEYEKQQSVVRRVYDPDTGRHRLVKGDGEIIEEIVSRDRQRAINKQATMGDGLSFQAQMKKLL